MEADAHFAGGGDFDIQQLAGRPLRKNVKVIGGGGAAGEQQLADADPRADIDGGGGQSAPDFIEADQPVEQFGILYRRNVAREGLVQMMVGVDEAGIHHVAAGFDDLGAGWRKGLVRAGVNRGDAVALDQHIRAVKRRFAVDHRDQGVNVLQQQGHVILFHIARACSTALRRIPISSRWGMIPFSMTTRPRAMVVTTGALTRPNSRCP